MGSEFYVQDGVVLPKGRSFASKAFDARLDLIGAVYDPAVSFTYANRSRAYVPLMDSYINNLFAAYNDLDRRLDNDSQNGSNDCGCSSPTSSCGCGDNSGSRTSGCNDNNNSGNTGNKIEKDLSGNDAAGKGGNDGKNGKIGGASDLDKSGKGNNAGSGYNDGLITREGLEGRGILTSDPSTDLKVDIKDKQWISKITKALYGVGGKEGEDLYTAIAAINKVDNADKIYPDKAPTSLNMPRELEYAGSGKKYKMVDKPNEDLLKDVEYNRTHINEAPKAEHSFGKVTTGKHHPVKAALASDSTPEIEDGTPTKKMKHRKHATRKEREAYKALQAKIAAEAKKAADEAAKTAADTEKKAAEAKAEAARKLAEQRKANIAKQQAEDAKNHSNIIYRLGSGAYGLISGAGSGAYGLLCGAGQFAKNIFQGAPEVAKFANGKPSKIDGRVESIAATAAAPVAKNVATKVVDDKFDDPKTYDKVLTGSADAVERNPGAVKKIAKATAPIFIDEGLSKDTRKKLVGFIQELVHLGLDELNKTENKRKIESLGAVVANSKLMQKSLDELVDRHSGKIAGAALDGINKPENLEKLKNTAKTMATQLVGDKNPELADLVAQAGFNSMMKLVNAPDNDEKVQQYLDHTFKIRPWVNSAVRKK